MASGSIAFGTFDFHPDSGILTGAGVSVPLGRRAAALLHILLQSEGRVLSKWELLDLVWPAVAVEEGNLAVQIAALRKCLGPRPEGGEWIVTVPRVGYRFALADATGALPQGIEPLPPAIAVLSFETLAEERGDDRYFAEGVAIDIGAALARFRSLRVIVHARGGASERPCADYLLTGTVRRYGTHLRISVQLLETVTSRQIWAETFDGGVDDVFAFQDQITQGVASLVEPEIKRAEIERSRRERPGSFALYDVYLRSLAELQEESPDANARAHGLLLQALAVEPDNPVLLAHAAWALEHRNSMGWQPLGADDVGQCLAYARRGLQHAGGDARVMAQCGMALLQAGRDYDAGLQVIRLAAEANPHDLFVIAAAGIATLHCGEMDEAMALMHRALALGPRDPQARFSLTGLAMAAIMRCDDEDALIWASRSLAVHANFDATYWMIIAANAHLGRQERARQFLHALMGLAPGVSLASIRAGQPARFPDRTARVLAGLELAGMRAL